MIFRTPHRYPISRPWAGTSVLLALIMGAIAGCGGGGDSGSSSPGTSPVGIAVSGHVQTPGGLFARTPLTTIQWFASLFQVTESYAISIPGWSDAPGATVRVFVIDEVGNPTGAALATATTDSLGAFTLTLPTGTPFASNLIAQAENDASIISPKPVGTPNTLSVPLVAARVTINPAAAAATKALIDRPEPLADYTPAEVVQYLEAIETLVTQNAPIATTLQGALTEIATSTGPQMTTALDTLSGTVTKSPVILTATTPFPDGVAGALYSRSAVAVGGTGKLTWSAVENRLPQTGLALNGDTGVISGTPSVSGTFPFTLRVQDSSTPTPLKSGDVIFSIVIQAISGAPVFTLHPIDLIVTAGSSAVFQVSATGTPTISFQWQTSTDNGNTWNDYGGATGATWLIGTTNLSNDGTQFQAVATNGLGIALSNVATLRVNP